MAVPPASVLGYMRAMSHVVRIARHTALLTGAQFTGLGISLIGTVLVTRALGPESRGVYAWLLTLVGIAIQLALLAPAAVVRAVAVSAPARLPGTLLLLCLGGALLTGPLAAYAFLDPHIGADAQPFVALAWLAVPVTATTLSLATLVQAEARILPVFLIHVAPRIVQAILLGLLAASGRLDLPAAIEVFALTALVELAAALACLQGRLDRLRPSAALLRRFVGLIGGGWLSSLAIFAVPRIGLVVLGSSAPLEATGLYSLALTLQEAALVGPAALGGVLITHVGRHGWFGRKTQLQGGGGVLAFSLLTCGAVALVAPLLIPLLFGPAFASAADPFRLLMVSVVLATLYQLRQPLLYARGNPGAIAAPGLLASLVALATALAAVPRLGVGGAILSNIAGFATLAALAFVLSARTSRPVGAAS